MQIPEPRMVLISLSHLGVLVLVLNILNSMSFLASNDGISCEFYYQNSDFCKLFAAHPLVF